MKANEKEEKGLKELVLASMNLMGGHTTEDFKEKFLGLQGPRFLELFLKECQKWVKRWEENDIQKTLNGEDHLWILKPASMSRGRGIEVMNDLEKVVHYWFTSDIEWVGQKYIERPLIIHKKKFDIRQWILVTDFSPLTIWFYNDCYLRFCAEDYNTSEISNRFSHLSNNSIAKYSENFENQLPIFEGNMWHSDQFIEFLKVAFRNDRSDWELRVL